MEENKYHFAREVIFNLRSCHAISYEVYLHWIDKLNNDERKASRIPANVGRSEQLVCDIEKGTKCKHSFPDYKDGKCRMCGGQAN
jgi:hypothetical protein